MHDHPALVFIAVLILVFGLMSKLTERSPFTGPMFFVLVGLIAGNAGLALFELHISAALVKTVAELTLLLILFVDGSLINIGELRRASPRIALRLLGIGLPLCMILGFLFGMLLFPSMGLWMVALVALILSPTDAALGQAVIKSENVPLATRRAISVESGLNDGIALPPVLICIAALAAGGTIDTSEQWGMYTAKQLILGPLIGAAVGWIGGKMVEKADQRGWMDHTFQRLACISLAIVSYAFAELFHGNGFIAAFCGGLFLGSQSHDVRERIQEYGETEGQLLVLMVFLVFGMVAVPMVMPYWDINVWIYAALSLTVIRMLPAALSLLGSGLDWKTIGFIGWFGPRGIASFLYLLIVVGELGFAGYEKMMSVIVLTVLLSVFLHGLTAVPFSKLMRQANG